MWRFPGTNLEGNRPRATHVKKTFNSSPVASDGNVLASNNDGPTFVVKAGKEFEVLATNELGERITASPAITGQVMVYRTDSHLYCVGRGGKK